MNVFIVDGARTPYLKATGEPGPFSASDLAVAVGRSCCYGNLSALMTLAK